MSRLIITNGDAAAEILGAAGLGGRIVPWRDVLHEGPLIPANRLEDFSDARAEYLSRRFGIPFAEARTDFLARDAVVRAHYLFDTVAIWLEHDLYDQLQLLQMLDFFAAEQRTEGLELVQADDFLGSQRPEDVARFAADTLTLTPALLAAGAAIWRALCEPSPDPVRKLRGSVPDAFRFLGPALDRFVEELPALANGLSRSEQVIVEAVAGGGLTPRDVFRRLLASEEAAFMGDWSAFRIIDDLAGAEEPPITGLEGAYPCQGGPAEIETYLATPLALTDFGRSVLAGDADMIAVNGADRWWGGTHLRGRDCWRWDGAARRIVPSAATAGREQSEQE